MNSIAMIRRSTLQFGDTIYDISNLLLQQEQISPKEIPRLPLKLPHLYPSAKSIIDANVVVVVVAVDNDVNTKPQQQQEASTTPTSNRGDERGQIIEENVNKECPMTTQMSQQLQDIPQTLTVVTKSTTYTGGDIMQQQQQQQQQQRERRTSHDDNCTATTNKEGFLRLDDMDPSRVHLRRPQQQQQRKQQPVWEEEEFESVFDDWIKVTPELKLPIHGAKDTIIALKEGRIARHECWNCVSVVLGCIDTAHYVLCPNCRCVMPTGVPLEGNQYVGLGFYYSLYNEVDTGGMTAAAATVMKNSPKTSSSSSSSLSSRRNRFSNSATKEAAPRTTQNAAA